MPNGIVCLFNDNKERGGSRYPAGSSSSDSGLRRRGRLTALGGVLLRSSKETLRLCEESPLVTPFTLAESPEGKKDFTKLLMLPNNPWDPCPPTSRAVRRTLVAL